MNMDRHRLGEEPKTKIVVVTGGRDFVDRACLEGALARLKMKVESEGRRLVIRHGACPTGADRMAEVWCRANGVETDPQPAAWKAEGKAAGMNRNRAMVAPGDVEGLLAVPGIVGTPAMVAHCRSLGIPVWEPCGDASAFRDGHKGQCGAQRQEEA